MCHTTEEKLPHLELNITIIVWTCPTRFLVELLSHSLKQRGLISYDLVTFFHEVTPLLPTRKVDDSSFFYCNMCYGGTTICLRHRQTSDKIKQKVRIV